MTFLRRTLISRPLAAGIVITLVTVALVGSILLTSTSMGCGPAQKVGLKLQRCSTPVAARPSPSPGNPTAPSPYQQPSPNPSSNPSSEPNPNPPSNPYPNPASGPAQPGGQPASGAYPPFVPPASSPGQAMPYSVTCRLPILSGGPGSGGFLVFPGGTYVADPASAVSLPSPPGSSSPSPQQGPGGPPGFYGLSYDRKFSRWLPVPYNWVTADGSRYAFATTDAVYVDDLATGALTALGKGHAWSIVGVQAAGVYAIQPNVPGLWLLPFSGSGIVQLVGTGWWQAVSADAAYGTETSAVPPGVANTIIRFDLTAGTTENWFTRDGAQGSVMGFDVSGNPVLVVQYFSQGSEVWLTTGPSQGTPIMGSQYGGLTLNGNMVGDSNGIWFPVYYQYAQGGSPQEMALYVPGKGVFGMSNISGQLAGPCL